MLEVREQVIQDYKVCGVLCRYSDVETKTLDDLEVDTRVIAVIAIFLLFVISLHFAIRTDRKRCPKKSLHTDLRRQDSRPVINEPEPKPEPKPKPRVSEELRKYEPELFDVVPSSFLPEYKNPCFYQGGSSSGELYCLPYFYIVGMAKCGTTDVWDKIVAHPDVIDVPKEPHWWGLRRFRTDTVKLYQDKVDEVLKMPGSPTTTSINYYLNWFKKFAVPEVTATYTNNFYPKVFGDASVSTATGVSDNWKHVDPEAKEPRYVTADLLHAVQPDAKIIIMIRNTTVWAQSWFRYSIGGATAETFNTTMLQFIDCVKKCLRSHTERYCAYTDSCGRETYHPLRDVHIGVYHWFIRDWIRTYSRQRIMVIPLEDWQTKKAEVYRDILKYLKLRQLTQEEEVALLGRKTKNTMPRKLVMFPDIQVALEQFFRPHNRKLAELLQDNRFNAYV